MTAKVEPQGIIAVAKATPDEIATMRERDGTPKWEFPADSFSGDWWVMDFLSEKDATSAINSYRAQAAKRFKLRAQIYRQNKNRRLVVRVTNVPFVPGMRKGGEPRLPLDAKGRNKVD